MDALNRLVEPMQGILLLMSVLGVIALSVGMWRLHLQNKALKARWRDLLQGVDAENVETMLHDHLRSKEQMEAEIDSLKARTAGTETKLRTAKRFVGLVRYDAFPEVGGEQSFSLAIFDDEGNGAVLTSQVGRDSSRIFGKRLRAGEAERGLSDEEAKAIEEAAGTRSRPRITR
jgi:hypothetical protein